MPGRIEEQLRCFYASKSSPLCVLCFAPSDDDSLPVPGGFGDTAKGGIMFTVFGDSVSR